MLYNTSSTSNSGAISPIPQQPHPQQAAAMMSPDRGALHDPVSVIDYCNDVGAVFREWIESTTGDPLDRCATCRKPRPNPNRALPAHAISTYSQLVDKFETQGFVTYDGVPHCFRCAKRLLTDVLLPHFKMSQGHGAELIKEQLAAIDNLSGYQPRLDTLDLCQAQSVSRGESDSLFEALAFQLFRNRSLGQLLRLVVCDRALSEQAVYQPFLFPQSQQHDSISHLRSRQPQQQQHHQQQFYNAPPHAVSSPSSAYFYDPSIPLPTTTATTTSAGSPVMAPFFSAGGGLLFDADTLAAGESARFIQYLAEASEPGGPTPLRFVPMVLRIVASHFSVNVHLIDTDRLVQDGRWHVMFSAPMKAHRQSASPAAAMASDRHPATSPFSPPHLNHVNQSATAAAAAVLLEGTPSDIFLVSATADAPGVVRRYHSFVALPSETADITIPYMRWLRVTCGSITSNDVIKQQQHSQQGERQSESRRGHSTPSLRTLRSGEDDIIDEGAEGVVSATTTTTMMSPHHHLHHAQLLSNNSSSSRLPSATRSCDGATQTAHMEQVCFVDVPKKRAALSDDDDDDDDDHARRQRSGEHELQPNQQQLEQRERDLRRSEMELQELLSHSATTTAAGASSTAAVRLGSKISLRFAHNKALGISSFMQPSLVEPTTTSTAGGSCEFEVFPATAAQDVTREANDGADDNAVRYGQPIRLLHSQTGLWLASCTDGSAFWLSFTNSGGTATTTTTSQPPVEGASRENTLWRFASPQGSVTDRAADVVSNLSLVALESVACPAVPTVLLVTQHDVNHRAVAPRPRSMPGPSRSTCRVFVNATATTPGSSSGTCASLNITDKILQFRVGTGVRSYLAIDVNNRRLTTSTKQNSPETFFRLEKTSSSNNNKSSSSGSPDSAYYRIFGFQNKTELVVTSVQPPEETPQRGGTAADDEHDDDESSSPPPPPTVSLVLRKHEDRQREGGRTSSRTGWKITSVQGTKQLFLSWNHESSSSNSSSKKQTKSPSSQLLHLTFSSSSTRGIALSPVFDSDSHVAAEPVREATLRRIRCLHGLSTTANQLIATSSSGDKVNENMLRVLATTVSSAVAECTTWFRDNNKIADELAWIANLDIVGLLCRVISVVIPPHRVPIVAAATKQDAAASIGLPALQSVAVAIDRSPGVAIELGLLVTRCFSFLNAVIEAADAAVVVSAEQDDEDEEPLSRRLRTTQLARFAAEHCLLSDLGGTQFALAVIKNQPAAAAFTPDELRDLIHVALDRTSNIDGALFAGVFHFVASTLSFRGAGLKGPQSVAGASILLRRSTAAAAAAAAAPTTVNPLLFGMTLQPNRSGNASSSSGRRGGGDVSVTVPGLQKHIISLSELVNKAQLDRNAHAQAVLESLAAQLDLFGAMCIGGHSENIEGVAELASRELLEYLAFSSSSSSSSEEDDAVAAAPLVDDTLRAAALRLYLDLHVIGAMSRSRSIERTTAVLLERGSVVIQGQHQQQQQRQAEEDAVLAPDLDLDLWRIAVDAADAPLRSNDKDALDFFLRQCSNLLMHDAGWHILELRKPPSRAVAAVLDCLATLVRCNVVSARNFDVILEMCIGTTTATSTEVNVAESPLYRECCQSAANLLNAMLEASILVCAVRGLLPSFNRHVAAIERARNKVNPLQAAGNSKGHHHAIEMMSPASKDNDDDDRANGGTSAEQEPSAAAAKYAVASTQQQDNSEEAEEDEADKLQRWQSVLPGDTAVIARILMRLAIRHRTAERAAADVFFGLLARWTAFPMTVVDTVSRLRIVFSGNDTTRTRTGATATATATGFSAAQKRHISTTVQNWRSYLVAARAVTSASSARDAGLFLNNEPRGPRAVLAAAEQQTMNKVTNNRNNNSSHMDDVTMAVLTHFFAAAARTAKKCSCETITAAKIFSASSLRQWLRSVTRRVCDAVTNGDSNNGSITNLEAASLADSLLFSRSLIQCDPQVAETCFADAAFTSCCLTLCNAALDLPADSPIRESAIVLLADVVVCGRKSLRGDELRELDYAVVHTLLDVLRCSSPAGDASVEVQAALSGLLRVLATTTATTTASGSAEHQLASHIANHLDTQARLQQLLLSNIDNIPLEAGLVFGRVHELCLLCAAWLLSTSAKQQCLSAKQLATVVRHTPSPRARCIALALLASSEDDAAACRCMSLNCSALPHEVSEIVGATHPSRWSLVPVQSTNDSSSFCCLDAAAAIAQHPQQQQPQQLQFEHEQLASAARNDDDFAQRLKQYVRNAKRRQQQQNHGEGTTTNEVTAGDEITTDDNELPLDKSALGTTHLVLSWLASLVNLAIIILLFIFSDEAYESSHSKLDPDSTVSTADWALGIALIALESLSLLVVIANVASRKREDDDDTTTPNQQYRLLAQLRRSHNNKNNKSGTHDDNNSNDPRAWVDSLVRILVAMLWVAFACLGFFVNASFRLFFFCRLAALVPMALRACSPQWGVGYGGVASRTRCMATSIAGFLPIVIVAVLSVVGHLLLYSAVAFFGMTTTSFFSSNSTTAFNNNSTSAINGAFTPLPYASTLGTAPHHTPCSSFSRCTANVIYLFVGSGRGLSALIRPVTEIADLRGGYSWAWAYAWMFFEALIVASILSGLFVIAALTVQQMVENARSLEASAALALVNGQVDDSNADAAMSAVAILSNQDPRSSKKHNTHGGDEFEKRKARYMTRLQLAEYLVSLDRTELTPAEESALQKIEKGEDF